jgi:Fe-S-cluster containining protein
MGIFLFPKEAKKLKRLAKIKKLKLTIYPQQGITKSHKKANEPEIIYSYQIANTVCPFLIAVTNRCSIYEDRPIACRSFPVLTFPPVVLIPECNWVKNFFSGKTVEAGNAESFLKNT